MAIKSTLIQPYLNYDKNKRKLIFLLIVSWSIYCQVIKQPLFIYQLFINKNHEILNKVINNKLEMKREVTFLKVNQTKFFIL